MEVAAERKVTKSGTETTSNLNSNNKKKYFHSTKQLRPLTQVISHGSQPLVHMGTEHMRDANGAAWMEREIHPCPFSANSKPIVLENAFLA